MSIHTPVTKAGIYFLTFTCHKWLPLIEQTKGYDLIYNWFDILRSRGNEVNAYVLMPNHLHILMYYTGLGQSLNTIIGNGKRFLAYDIVKRLEEGKHTDTISILQQDVVATDRKRGKKHEVWKDSFDVKECRTEKFVLQKLNYIHTNPCAGKWKLAESPIHYLHSSASFYISGKQGLWNVKDYREFLKVE
jgi:REP element-mobilizing transposase RayT